MASWVSFIIIVVKNVVVVNLILFCSIIPHPITVIQLGDASASGCIELVQWIIDTGFDLSHQNNHSFAMRVLLQNTIEKGHWKIIQLLIEQIPMLKHNFDIVMLKAIIESGNYMFVKWTLQTLGSHLAILDFNLQDDILNPLAIHGELSCTQLALDLFHKTYQMQYNVHAEKDALFRTACKHGHNHVLQYILTFCQNNNNNNNNHVDIHYNEEEAFRNACHYGHFNTACFLLNLPGSMINIRARNHDAFRSACRNQHTYMVNWFMSLMPNEYIETVHPSQKQQQQQQQKRQRHHHHHYYMIVQRELYICPASSRHPCSEPKCCVCFTEDNDRTNQIVVTQCNHAVCFSCINQWKQQNKPQHLQQESFSCPLCRQHVMCLFAII